MAPENPPSLVIFNARFEDDRLIGLLQYIESQGPNRLRVRWNVGSQPENYLPVGEGVAYVHDQAVVVMPMSEDATPNYLGDSRYQWTEGLQHGLPWTMFILILPEGHTLVNPQPKPAGTKVHQNRLAVYWILEADDLGRTKVEWTVTETHRDINSELLRVNKDYLTDHVPAPSSIEVEDITISKTILLRSILAALYSDDESARRIVSDAGLSSQRITFSGSAINTWNAILREAENTNRIEHLFKIVLGEYGANQKLVQAIGTYRRQVQSKSEDSAEPVSQSARTGESSVVKILFLAANPTGTTRLRLDEESRNIDHTLRQAEYRDRFDIRQHFAVRIADLQGLLLRHQPHVVHFSGHGSEANEIILEDNAGQSHPVSPRALSRLFSILKDNIRCVVLNACYSEGQARAIAEHIDCVVGMTDAIGDRAAISFATSFYQALGYGRNVKTAFDLGCAQIDLENIPEEHVPKLLTTKVDPAQIALVSPREQG